MVSGSELESRFLAQSVTKGTCCVFPGFAEALFLVRAGSGDGPVKRGNVRIGAGASKDGGKATVRDPASCCPFKAAGPTRDREVVYRFFKRKWL